MAMETVGEEGRKEGGREGGRNWSIKRPRGGGCCCLDSHSGRGAVEPSQQRKTTQTKQKDGYTTHPRGIPIRPHGAGGKKGKTEGEGGRKSPGPWKIFPKRSTQSASW